MNTGLQSQIRAYGSQLVQDQDPITHADTAAFLDTIRARQNRISIRPLRCRRSAAYCLPPYWAAVIRDG